MYERLMNSTASCRDIGDVVEKQHQSIVIVSTMVASHEVEDAKCQTNVVPSPKTRPGCALHCLERLTGYSLGLALNALVAYPYLLEWLAVHLLAHSHS